jgi:hypothetical protein
MLPPLLTNCHVTCAKGNSCTVNVSTYDMVPLTLRSPVTLTCAEVGLTAITALPLLLLILVTVVVVVIWRTSIKSPLSGASVKVSVVVDTEYADVGI